MPFTTEVSWLTLLFLALLSFNSHGLTYSELDQVDNFHHYSNHSLCNTTYLSPRRTPLREDSVCKLLENTCDQDLLSDLDDEDEEIELLVEVGQEGHVPVLVHRQVPKTNNPTIDEYYEDDDESISLRDSFPLGAGCLPCTPKSQKKTVKNQCQHGKSTNWCCGVVASTVKKTTKKF